MNTNVIISNANSISTNAIPTARSNSFIQVVVLASLEALEPYAEQWDQLALQAPQQLPMLSAAWVMAYLEHCLGPQESWRCYLATEPDGRLVGVLPIIKTPHPLWHSFLPILHTPWDWHTRSGDLLANSGMEREIFKAFLKVLREEFGSCFILEMKGIRDNSPTLKVLDQHITGWEHFLKREPPGAFIKIDGSFEKFQEKFSSDFKSTLRRKSRRIAELPGFALDFLTGPSADLDNLKKFLELEASGWKGEEGTAIIHSSSLKAFYIELGKKLAERGWLELHLLQTEQKVIAGSFAVQFGTALIIPKLSYDESLSKFSPWSVLFHSTIERAFNGGNCREINLLGDSEWFSRWKMELGAYWQAHLFPSHPIPLLLGKMPMILRTKLGKIKWIRNLYQRLSNVRRGWGEN